MDKNQNNTLRKLLNTYLKCKCDFISIKDELFPVLLDICARMQENLRPLAQVLDVDLPCDYSNGEGEVRVSIDVGGPYQAVLSFPVKYIDMPTKEIYEDIEKCKNEADRKDKEYLLQQEKALYIRLRKKFGRKKASRRKHEIKKD